MKPSASHSAPETLARVKSNGSSDRGRMRSTFQAWKNSCETDPRSHALSRSSVALAVSTVLLRCSIASPLADGR